MDSYNFFLNIGVKEVSFTPDNNIDTFWSEKDLILIKKFFNDILEKDEKN
jgi:hypothetical protein